MRCVKPFSQFELACVGTPVKPALDAHQFVSIIGVEFDGQWPITKIAVMHSIFRRLSSVNVGNVR